MLRDALYLAGHEVHTCADGNAGVEAARALRPDIALIDIGLPGASGYAVAERIRAESGGNAMLLIAVTGYGQPEDRARSLAAGFDLHATKPIDMVQLLATIALWPGTVTTDNAAPDPRQFAP
jgi:DNA-binding response OmpR family regulator